MWELKSVKIKKLDLTLLLTPSWPRHSRHRACTFVYSEKQLFYHYYYYVFAAVIYIGKIIFYFSTVNTENCTFLLLLLLLLPSNCCCAVKYKNKSVSSSILHSRNSTNTTHLYTHTLTHDVPPHTPAYKN